MQPVSLAPVPVAVNGITSPRHVLNAVFRPAVICGTESGCFPQQDKFWRLVCTDGALRKNGGAGGFRTHMILLARQVHFCVCHGP